MAILYPLQSRVQPTLPFNLFWSQCRSKPTSKGPIVLRQVQDAFREGEAFGDEKYTSEYVDRSTFTAPGTPCAYTNSRALRRETGAGSSRPRRCRCSEGRETLASHSTCKIRKGSLGVRKSLGEVLPDTATESDGYDTYAESAFKESGSDTRKKQRLTLTGGHQRTPSDDLRKQMARQSKGKKLSGADTPTPSPGEDDLPTSSPATHLESYTAFDRMELETDPSHPFSLVTAYGRYMTICFALRHFIDPLRLQRLQASALTSTPASVLVQRDVVDVSLFGLLPSSGYAVAAKTVLHKGKQPVLLRTVTPLTLLVLRPSRRQGRIPTHDGVQISLMIGLYRPGSPPCSTCSWPQRGDRSDTVSLHAMKLAQHFKLSVESSLPTGWICQIRGTLTMASHGGIRCGYILAFRPKVWTCFE
jgi:hypothetical protein